MKKIVITAVFLSFFSFLIAQIQTQLLFPDFHNGAVSAIDISRNNKWILTGGADGRAMLTEAETRVLIRQFRGHFDAITGVAFADLDRKVVSSSFDGKLMIWDARSGDQKRIWNVFSGAVDPQKNWSRNPLFPPFCLDSSKNKMVFYSPRTENTDESFYPGKNLKLCFYDFKKDSVLWTMPVNGCEMESRPFTLNHSGEWLLLTDFKRNAGTGNLEPFIRLIYTADTALQYKWWGNEAVFEGNEVIICNGHNILRFNPAHETAALRNINGGYGYYKQFSGSGYLLMQCMQQKEAGNIAARNFNIKSPFQTTADSILYYLTGSREMKLPYWRVSDLKNQLTYTIRIQNDSGASWQPVYRLNESLSNHGLLAFTKENEKFAFVEMGTGKSVVMKFFPGKSFPKTIIPLKKSAGKWLVSMEHEPANKHEFALYELTLDFSKGAYALAEFISSPILNQSLSVEDDNQIIADLIIFPDGNRVLSSDKAGGIRISDYSNGVIKEKAAVLPESNIPLGPAAVNAEGSLIRCFSTSKNIYTFSSKSGQPQLAKRSEDWRLLPDQTLFNKNMVCYAADSIWKIEYAAGKALVNNQKHKTYSLVFTGETGMSDFLVVNDKLLMGMGSDGGLRAYSLESGQRLFTQYLFKNGGNLVIAPDGRMDANEQAKKFIYAVDGFNIMTIAESNKYNGTAFSITPGLRRQLLR
jgi:WD40 repeat protein